MATTISGRLSIVGNNSFLMPGNAWLLMAGYPDAGQAGLVATRFIVKTRQLQTNANVQVIGTRGVVQTQPVIAMTDITGVAAELTPARAARAVDMGKSKPSKPGKTTTKAKKAEPSPARVPAGRKATKPGPKARK